MFIHTANKHPLALHPLRATRSSSLEVRGGRGEKMLTVALSPVKRPPSLLSRLTRYHANGAVTESLLLAPHSGSVDPLQRGQTDAAYTLWVLLQKQKAECDKRTKLCNSKTTSAYFRLELSIKTFGLLSCKTPSHVGKEHMRKLH